MQHIHIIGIGGTFMGGLARIAKEAGFKVTGCDAKMYPPMSTQLEELGVTVHEGFDTAQLDEFKADMYVIGNVAKRGMDVIEGILNKNLPYTSGPQWLAENVLHKMWVLGVAGTHGKTTTASMLAWVLEHAGYGAGFLIGGVPQNFSVSARLPQNDSAFFVIEADEYDTAFFDKRSKFVHYRPRTAILNNLEYDHADIFPDLHAIQTQFHHLVRTVPNQGLIVANGREESLHETIERGCWTPIEWFGNQAGWQIANVGADGSFDVHFKGKHVGHIAWELLGEHNRMNALAVIAAAQHVGVSVQAACEALSQFKNVKRRMEIKGVENSVTVYDDFAHHPTAISTTVAGLRDKVGAARIIAVLEPRSNTMKLGTMKTALSGSLKDADQVFCYAGGVDWDVADALAPLGDKLHVGKDFDEFVNAIAAEAKSGDHVLVMSNGGFGGIHDKLLAKLKLKKIQTA
ncbi:UDP-N-acetylmuramate:L-alanyl-gamma-D-glutamyl-meso-diaminopimelate ligase [Kingella kingae]|uniref:UDP-N-acetylmuramate:L-alanyl-gamma-D-glutamyl- meso-diaminopimelate ligase n=2 Tax=Kingella kingae TaxID=504 RepID=UPI0025507A4E|nr:UDP-N-acetylmuramate:L-alanyl-gamma-D-glutamyl-meso-diaminopimelate ligase [Kingella kingae]MDK4576115.1 UDP-N-acetylmuramate:L-alanyl-gamma-D-glutamyl-meso-diaminopimelate ligase [Kingella kingae]MDK4582106.1 UDP-N-acetylmuramate:L-alanyl-gamma-D-glutamyl-meso-diaminopimelate ligase [Kingella kingae]MDK4585506.1 UDP-N-acetylmuramate:L-alanyl-gamma-D-glutamyl-meso-diaminopimelate ligase [Kingella kingae]MDK4592310.1 UDP-N-acetylmuramate:L-alanyl-gamma-D-glutamyl-meso-diaminopimelate ligase [